MKTSVSLTFAVLWVALVFEVNCAGLFEAVQSVKPCLDKASQKKISLVAALTAPEDWYEKCFVACLAKKMGNVSDVSLSFCFKSRREIFQSLLWDDHRCSAFFDPEDEGLNDEEQSGDQDDEQSEGQDDEEQNDEEQNDEESADDEQADDATSK